MEKKNTDGLQQELMDSPDLEQFLLKLCGMAQLYPKLKRDAIIYYGLLHGLSLFEINDKLFDKNEETLF